MTIVKIRSDMFTSHNLFIEKYILDIWNAKF